MFLCMRNCNRRFALKLLLDTERDSPVSYAKKICIGGWVEPNGLLRTLDLTKNG